MAQKLMLRKFNSQQILLMMYLGCAIVFMPMVEFSQVQELTPLALICFIYCCLNTLIDTALMRKHLIVGMYQKSVLLSHLYLFSRSYFLILRIILAQQILRHRN